MSVIQTERLTRSYGSRRGILDVQLAIPEGSLYGFLGPNGAGKTTTMRVLLGFLPPTSGSARVFGLDCWKDTRKIKSDIGYLPGDLRLWPWLNGLDALRLFARIRQRDMLRHGREIADSLELDLSIKVRTMSKGTRQKLGIVLALAHKPKLLVLDEPSSGLDPLMQDRFRGLLRQVSVEGRTVLLSSHTLQEVEDLCEQVAIVRAGRIVANDRLDHLQRQAGHDVTITWATQLSAAQPAPGMLEQHSREGLRWHGRVRGPVGPLIEFLAGKPVEDLRIARPDLESLFRSYYQPGEGAIAQTPSAGGAK